MKRIKTLVGKEILDILRDKKTLIVMVAVPVLLYPAIIMGMVLLMGTINQSQLEKEYTVAYSEQYEHIADELKDIYADKKEEQDIKLVFMPENEGAKGEEGVNYDVWAEFTENENGISIVAEYTSTNQDSAYAENALSWLAEEYQEELMRKQLKEYGLAEEFLHPLTYEAKDSVSVSESTGMNLGGSIGMLLVLTIMLGAFYPAIDATTGEKERGTLETLLTLPVSNFQMIMSKYIAVSVFACVTAVLSLLSMGASVLFLINSAAEAAGLDSFSMAAMPGYLAVLLPAMLVTALLITAFCMCFCIFAKSFKEANNYITPVMLIVMFASMAGMIPSVQLDYGTSLIPIVNVTLLMKQVMAQQLEPVLAGITILINLCYSILIIWVLAKMYDSENVLFNDGFQSFRLFEKRSQIKQGTVPRIGDLILIIAILLLLMLYLGTAVSVRSAIGGTVVNQILILTIPLLTVWYMKTDAKQLLSLNVPRLRHAVGGLVLYAGSYCLMLVISFVMMRVFPQSAENVNLAFDELLKAPAALTILVMALMPAIGEEIFFRGFLYGSLKHRYGVVCAIILSSLVFGAFHMSLVKLLPTAILGACFAYIAYRSDSIFVGMLFHFINNMFSFAAMKEPEWIGRVFPILMKDQLAFGEMLVMLLAAAVGIAAGIFIIGKGTNNCERK